MFRSNFSYKMYIFIIIILSLTTLLNAQDIDIFQRVEISKDTIYIGELANIKIIINSQNTQIDSISSKFIKKTPKQLYISIDHPWIKTNNHTWEKRYSITAFDSGNFFLPQLNIKLWYKNKQKLTNLIIDSIGFNVVPMPIDTSKAYKPIKNIYDISQPPLKSKWWLWLIISISAIILILIIILIYRNNKIRKEQKSLYYNPELTPIEEAMQALKQLKENNSIAQMNAKEYYTILTDTLRRFILRIYNIKTFEMLSSEIFLEMHKYCNSTEWLAKLQQFLNTSDLTKFAKYTPTLEERYRDYEFCNQFINYLWEQEQLKKEQYE